MVQFVSYVRPVLRPTASYSPRVNGLNETQITINNYGAKMKPVHLTTEWLKPAYSPVREVKTVISIAYSPPTREQKWSPVPWSEIPRITPVIPEGGQGVSNDWYIHNYSKKWWITYPMEMQKKENSRKQKSKSASRIWLNKATRLENNT